MTPGAQPGPTYGHFGPLGAEASTVADALGLGREHEEFLRRLAEVGPPGPPLSLPSPQAAGELLTRLGCPSEAVADALATWPTPEGSPELWWLLERSQARLARDLGDADADRGGWAQLPEALGPAGGCFYLHLFLACLPTTLAWHRDHGVPDDITWATLADLGRHVEIHRAVTGRTGVDEPWWMTLHLRCIVFEVGRLQYTPFRLGSGPEHPPTWYSPEAVAEMGEGFRDGDAVLGVHIPPGPALTSEACESSARRARAFFDHLVPVTARRLAVCSSWLLDDQLVPMLAPGSNIIAFQRSFELVPGWTDGDHGVFTFVFRREPGHLDDLPLATSLQRAVVGHLRQGGHFHWRTGWRDLPEAG